MSVSAVLVRAIVDAVERAGTPREALLAAAGIGVRRLEDVHERFAFDEFTRLQTQVLALTGDPAFGLHLAERATEASLDLLAHLVSHSPTLREAVSVCLQFHRLLMDDAVLVLRERGAVATLRYDFARSADETDRMLAEFVMAGFSRLVHAFAGPNSAVQSVSFEHARPSYHAEYARLFGGVERFSQRATSIAFDRACLDRPQMHQHPALYSILRAEAERALGRVTFGVGLSDRLRQYLLARPPARIPDVTTAASDLGMSVRSLRRRLSAEETSYRDLVRSALETSAGHMLRDPQRSIQETAHALGFSDAGTFHRAFKRWTGMTPKAYREQSSGGGGVNAEQRREPD